MLPELSNLLPYALLSVLNKSECSLALSAEYDEAACVLVQEETAVSKLERALAANRRLQDRLVGILDAIDGALWSNAQMQAKLMHNSWLHPRAGRYRGMRGTPWSYAPKLCKASTWLPTLMDHAALAAMPYCQSGHPGVGCLKMTEMMYNSAI